MALPAVVEAAPLGGLRLLLGLVLVVVGEFVSETRWGIAAVVVLQFQRFGIGLLFLKLSSFGCPLSSGEPNEFARWLACVLAACWFARWFLGVLAAASESTSRDESSSCRLHTGRWLKVLERSDASLH